MSSLSNHLNGQIQPTNGDLNIGAIILERTDQETLRYNVCNLQNFTTYRGLNQHLRLYLKKPRNSDVNIFASQQCS